MDATPLYFLHFVITCVFLLFHEIPFSLVNPSNVPLLTGPVRVPPLAPTLVTKDITKSYLNKSFCQQAN